MRGAPEARINNVISPLFNTCMAHHPSVMGLVPLILGRNSTWTCAVSEMEAGLLWGKHLN